MEQIKVIVNGVGGIGSQTIRMLKDREGVRVVAAVDIDPEKIGRDAGEVAGVGPIGVVIRGDLEEVCAGVKADVAVNVAKSAEADETFRQMLPAIRHGINVIVANSATVCLLDGEEALAAEIDKVCKEYGVSYLGMGNTQTTQRLLLALAEGATDIKKVTFTHWADVHAFSPTSNANQLGITLHKDEYERRQKEGSIATLVKWREDVVYGIGRKLGWEVEKVTTERELQTDKNGIIDANISKFIGYVGGEPRLVMEWVFLLDPEKKYYDRIIIDGSPYIDSINNFSPDRGKCSTYASICHALPAAVEAAPGYIPTYDLALCTPDGI